MKVKVLKLFKDKYTKNLYEVGTELTISDERFEEINSTAHGALVEEIKEINYEKMTKEELVECAAEHNIKLNMSMTKAEMIKMLLKK